MSNTVLRQSEKECRRLARSHYENFAIASILLPRRLRQPFYNVYAFCRTADDFADESETPEIATQRLLQFQQHLDSTYAGNPPEDLFVALAHTISAFDLPKQLFDDLLSAFQQDQTKSRYANFDELHDYCRRSANPVGRIVLHLVGAFNETNEGLSDEICTGLQLVNFAQDVARDYAIDRIYIPSDEMDAFRVSVGMFDSQTTCREVRDLVQSQTNRATEFLNRGMPLADRVPKWFSSDVRLFVHGGMATADAIRKIGFDVLRIRPKVSKLRQARLLLRVMCGML